MHLTRRDLLRYSFSLAGSLGVSTLLTACTFSGDRSALSDAVFAHGVASGDPASDGFVLWTRAAPGAPGEPGEAVHIAWELAADPGFHSVLRSGTATTDERRDYTVKLHVRELEPGTVYFYRFLHRNGVSPGGRTRTLPLGPVEKMRAAVFSCANYPAGYFQAYGEASRLPDLDICIHLGDYLYEYGVGGYATERAVELHRTFAQGNEGELFSLADYRARYALYRSDTDLQAVHAAAPMIAVWDDHEIANDTWVGGAQNHSPEEGDFALRKAAAVQAYFEWLPLLPLIPDPQGRIYRGFEFGDLVSLHMLDTRLIGRDQQLEYGDFMAPEGGAIAPQEFAKALYRADRSLLGDEQRDWLFAALKSSSARWQVLGQQILMAKMAMPAQMLRALFSDLNFANTAPLTRELIEDKRALDAGESLDASRRRRLQDLLPYNLDAWDGYPAERDALYAQVRALGRQLLVLSGDTHNAWYSELRDRQGATVGVEFGVPGVSSPGMESYLQLNDGAAQELASALVTLIDELQYCQLENRGFLELEFTHAQTIARWHFIDDVTRRDYQVTTHSERVQA